MNAADASKLALELMDRYHLLSQGWRFQWNNRKRAAGVCIYNIKTIFLSEPITLLNDESMVRDTILHEIAHALAGAAAGHGYQWKLTAQSVGAKPVACVDSADIEMVPARWEAYCPNCGQVCSSFYRRPSENRRRACSPCCRKYNYGRFSDKYLTVIRKAV